MIIKRKILENYKQYKFSIPYGVGDTVLVTPGEHIKRGECLIKSRKSTRKNSFYIPEQIGCSLQDVNSVLECIDGEFVQEGDTLAQKVTTGGLMVKKLIAPSSGIVDLARIDNGYIDLLGEESATEIVSTFAGSVESISPMEGLTISASALALDILSISDMFDVQNVSKEKKIIGEFVSLGEGRDLRLKSDAESYHGKIVYVGKYLHIDLLHDLFQKGAAFVLTYSMDYEDFRRQGLPVGVIGGFGEIYSSNILLNKLATMDGKFVVVDYAESQIFFLQDENINSVKGNMFVENLNGAVVRSLLLSNYGMVGNVLSSDDEDGYIMVEWENGSSSMVDIGAVEFITL